MSAEPVIGAFCAALGLPPHALPLVLSFEHAGQLHLEQRDGFVLAYLTRRVPLYRRGVAAAALRAVHPGRGLPFAVHAAFCGEDVLVLLVRLPEETVDLPALNAVLQLLSRLADEAEAAGS
jgi:type III secretion system chaperone SycN